MSAFGTLNCHNCLEGFAPNEQIVNATGETYHTYCFVCAQCFQPFENAIYYEFEKRKYCEQDFQLLFAPCCRGCGEYVIGGRVIKAMNMSWHDRCFRCAECSASLSDIGFVKNGTRAFCRECNAKEKMKLAGKVFCHKCSTVIEDDLLKYKGETYHPYHFNCKSCSVELNGTAREIKGDLYCLRCHDKMNIPVCAACRTPIDEERVITALGKQWHAKHFVCTKCEQPFYGSRYYEKRGLAYCETHYNQLYGNPCFVCNRAIDGDAFTTWNKLWCTDHFCCYLCDERMNQKTKYYDFDTKPICKHCFEKLPSRIKPNVLKQYDQDSKFSSKKKN